MNGWEEGALERVRGVLAGSRAVQDWKLVRRRVESLELFFVRRELDLLRTRRVEHLDLTVYLDFEEEGRRLRGSAARRVPPTASPAEIAAIVESAAEAARQVRNPFFPLVAPGQGPAAGTPEAEPPAAPLAEQVEPATRALFREDRFPDGAVNSAELFLQRTDLRLLNSLGLDAGFRREGGLLELITSWRGPREEVELYTQERFRGVPLEDLARLVRGQLEASRDRALAVPTPSRRGLPILLVGEPVRDFLAYYRDQTSAENVYNRLSTARVGQALQPAEAGADRVTLRLDPQMEGSPDAAPFDEDGFPLAPVEVLREGVVRRLWGSLRHCSWLGVEPTGRIPGFLVEPGALAEAELAAGPHVELHSFSDFQCNTTTGDFGGEVRLGYLVEGGRRVPVTGGSIGGNLLEVQRTLRLSREVQRKESFRGPRALRLDGLALAGGEG